MLIINEQICFQTVCNTFNYKFDESNNLTDARWQCMDNGDVNAADKNKEEMFALMCGVHCTREF